jgi:hypothetical protein
MEVLLSEHFAAKSEVFHETARTPDKNIVLLQPTGWNDCYVTSVHGNNNSAHVFWHPLFVVWNFIKLSQYGRGRTGTNTTTVCKVRGLTLLLRVGTLRRCADGLFFAVPLLKSHALLTTLYPLLENVLQTVDYFEISCLGAPFSCVEKPRNRMGRDLNWILRSACKTWIGGTPLEYPQYSPGLAPCDFWAFPTMKRELWGKKFRNDQWSAARFREVGGAL